jgi:hypothetical protein
MAIKVSQLTADSSPTADDYVLAVDNGTNSSKKVTMGNLVASASDAVLKGTVQTVTAAKTFQDTVTLASADLVVTNANASISSGNMTLDAGTLTLSSGSNISMSGSGGIVTDGSIAVHNANVSITNGNLSLDATSSLNLADGSTVSLGTSSGSKIGTSTSQKLGFYNATPIVQPSGNALTALQNLGLVSSATLTATNVGLGNVDNTSNTTERAASRTLTNARITKRTGTAASSATPTINTDNVDYYSLTAQAVDITSFTTNLSGTPTEGQTLWIAITGTAARAITWGASFEASTVALPTTTVTTARLDVGFIWNSASTKWRVVAAV